MASHKKHKKLSPRREPVAYASLVPVLITVAAWLKLDLDQRTALEIITGTVALATFLRSVVSPACTDIDDDVTS